MSSGLTSISPGSSWLCPLLSSAFDLILAPPRSGNKCINCFRMRFSLYNLEEQGGFFPQVPSQYCLIYFDPNWITCASLSQSNFVINRTVCSDWPNLIRDHPYPQGRQQSTRPHGHHIGQGSWKEDWGLLIEEGNGYERRNHKIFIMAIIAEWYAYNGYSLSHFSSNICLALSLSQQVDCFMRSFKFTWNDINGLELFEKFWERCL